VIRGAAIAVAALCALATACADGKPRPPMSAGQRLYLAKCTSCHSAYEPRELTAEKWRTSLGEMELAKKVTLTNEERAEILAYVTAGR
jgi:hypothetical protein